MTRTIAELRSLVRDVAPREGEMYFTQPQINQIISYMVSKAQKSDEHHFRIAWERNMLLTVVLAETGARITEALMMDISYFDFDTRRVGVPRLKKHKRKKDAPAQKVSIPRDWIPMTDKLFDTLITYVERNGALPDGRLFPITARRYQMILEAAGKELGLPSCHPHMFRHSYAVRCLTDGITIRGVKYRVPLNTLKRFLGHANIRTTSVYTEVDGNAELTPA